MHENWLIALVIAAIGQTGALAVLAVKVSFFAGRITEKVNDHERRIEEIKEGCSERHPLHAVARGGAAQ